MSGCLYEALDSFVRAGIRVIWWRRYLLMPASAIQFPQIPWRRWRDKKQWKRVQAQCNLQIVIPMQTYAYRLYWLLLTALMLVSAGRERKWGWRWKQGSKGLPLCWRKWRQHRPLRNGFHPHRQTALRMLNLEGWPQQDRHSRSHSRWIQHGYSICLLGVRGFKSWCLLDFYCLHFWDFKFFKGM